MRQPNLPENSQKYSAGATAGQFIFKRQYCKFLAYMTETLHLSNSNCLISPPSLWPPRFYFVPMKLTVLNASYVNGIMQYSPSGTSLLYLA